MTSVVGAVFSGFIEKPILPEIVKSYSPFKLFILGVLVAPFIETLIFQAAIIEFFLYHLKIKHTIIPIFFSGVIFGLMHFMNTYNTAYMFYAMVMGFWFAMVYIFTKKEN